MKVLVVLSLLGLAAAKPQLILPYSGAHLLTPTIKADENTPVIDTYTASYPYAGFPFVQAALPYGNYRFPWTYSPVVTAVKPAEEPSRQKRSAEPEADPALLYTTGSGAINYPTLATIPTTSPINYQYTGLPAAINAYTYPQQTIPYTGLTPYTAGLTPYTAGFTPYTAGISPYTFPWTSPMIATRKAEEATPAEETGVARTKRSAEAEADPQILYSGAATGFTYPAVNTRTFPSTYTYQRFPLTYSQTPATTYTTGFPYTLGNIPTTFHG